MGIYLAVIILPLLHHWVQKAVPFKTRALEVDIATSKVVRNVNRAI